MRAKTIVDAIRQRHKSVVGDDPIGVVSVLSRSVKMTERDPRTVHVIATTDDIDLSEEVVLPAGADTSYFFRNGNIFAEHDTTLYSLVGKLRSPRPWPDLTAQRGWKVGVHVLDKPLGNEILDVVKAGGLGVSIGFRALDYGPPTNEEIMRYGKGMRFKSIVRKWEWLELSFTAFPCNVSAQSMAMVEGEKSEVLAEMIAKGRVRPETAAALGWSNHTRKRRLLRVKVTA